MIVQYDCTIINNTTIQQMTVERIINLQGKNDYDSVI